MPPPARPCCCCCCRCCCHVSIVLAAAAHDTEVGGIQMALHVFRGQGHARLAPPIRRASHIVLLGWSARSAPPRHPCGPQRRCPLPIPRRCLHVHARPLGVRRASPRRRRRLAGHRLRRRRRRGRSAAPSGLLLLTANGSVDLRERPRLRRLSRTLSTSAVPFPWSIRSPLLRQCSACLPPATSGLMVWASWGTRGPWGCRSPSVTRPT